jgi:beta-glucosidase
MRRLWLLLFVLVACDRPPIDRGTSSDTSGGTDLLGPDTAGGDVVPSGGACGDAPPLGKQALTTDPRVDVVLGDMTLPQKVAQMAGSLPAPSMFLQDDDEVAGIRGFRFRDGPRGVRMEASTATTFPVAVARAATWDLDLEQRVGEAMGAEVLGVGYNVLLAPTINVLRHPGWGRAQEAYGEDPWLTGMLGIAATKGIQQHVPACVKHFAANNIEDTRMTNNAVVDEQNLHENYARHFEMAVKEADAACIMAAYNKLNGTYCAENQPLLRDLLKDEWGFDGFVVSDWFATKTTVESALGGLDVEMPWRQKYAKLQSAVTAGQVPESVIDDAVRRVLRVKFKFGLALLSESVPGDPADVESPAHIGLTREAAAKGMVLLKNQGDVLPLARADTLKIAVVGPYADVARLGDVGSSNAKPSYAITPLAGIKAVAGTDAVVTSGKTASAAEGADVAIVIAALSEADEGEAVNIGGDRDTLDLSADQEQLILDASARAKKTVVVLEAGGPITMERWKDAADAIVMAWYPGMEGGRAIGDLLFGTVSPSGRLPQTWPVKWDDEPEFGNHQDETVFEYYHGYRHFDHAGITPLYPFGYGLAYTTFTYANLVVPCEVATPAARVVITVDVTNTGARKGVAVPQAYVGVPDSAVRRPVRQLAGFARVELLPGETKTVEIPLRVPDLAYWDVGKHAWVVEEKAHRVEVGPDARTLPLTGSFLVGDEGKEVVR